MRGIRKTLGRVAVVAGVIVATSGAFAPAMASDDYVNCRSGNLCAWVGPYYTQAPVSGGSQFSQENARWDSGWMITNADSSWYNNSAQNRFAAVYEYPNFGGRVEVCLRPGQRIGYQALDNLGTSNRWPYTAGGC
ncbi:peptidase inhibitor family I36 protein [Janibacter massiliensis]|uniref:peptidase inhibitor family I36 protein n=1 Tax=Janibacter massiliensis TaxID=2058291 RepID=UPI000D0F1CFE